LATATPAAAPSPRVSETPPPTTRPSPLASGSPPAKVPLTTTLPPVTVAVAPTTTPAAPVTTLPSPREAAEAPVPVATPAPRAAAPAEGWLLVLVTPWAEVSVDGQTAGTTPLGRISLKPGTHALMMTNPRFKPLTRSVVIRAGETTRVKLDFPTEGVRR